MLPQSSQSSITTCLQVFIHLSLPHRTAKQSILSAFSPRKWQVFRTELLPCEPENLKNSHQCRDKQRTFQTYPSIWGHGWAEVSWHKKGIFKSLGFGLRLGLDDPGTPRVSRVDLGCKDRAKVKTTACCQPISRNMAASAAKPWHSGFPLGEQSPLSGPSPLRSCGAEAICSSWLLAVKWPSLFLATMILIWARSVQISAFNFSVWSCPSEKRSEVPSWFFPLVCQWCTSALNFDGQSHAYIVVKKKTGSLHISDKSQLQPPFPCVVQFSVQLVFRVLLCPSWDIAGI